MKWNADDTDDTDAHRSVISVKSVSSVFPYCFTVYFYHLKAFVLRILESLYYLAGKIISIIRRPSCQIQKKSKVFISYSHDSDEHKDRVLALSDCLKTMGWLQYRPVWDFAARWMARWCNIQIEKADFVLVVCTGIYEARFKVIDSTEKVKERNGKAR